MIFTLFQGMPYICLESKTIQINMRNLSLTFSSLKMSDLDFTFLEMNPFTLVDGKPYPLDMRGELDDTASFKNFKKYIPFYQ